MEPNKPRVLIVDDDKDFTQGTRVMLEGAGFEVSIAENGLRAVEEIDIFQPDVIILDIYMPVMDGVKVCKFIRIEKGNVDLPIIAITAYDDETKKAEILASGANLYLTKPIDGPDLLNQVRQIIAKAREGGLTPPDFPPPEARTAPEGSAEEPPGES